MSGDINLFAKFCYIAVQQQMDCKHNRSKIELPYDNPESRLYVDPMRSYADTGFLNVLVLRNNPLTPSKSVQFFASTGIEDGDR